MKYILMILPAAAIVCGIFTGRLPEVSTAVLESADYRDNYLSGRADLLLNSFVNSFHRITFLSVITCRYSPESNLYSSLRETPAACAAVLHASDSFMPPSA